MQTFITEHAMQDNTTTTVKDILHTIVLATITHIIVAGIGGGTADAMLWRKYKINVQQGRYRSLHQYRYYRRAYTAYRRAGAYRSTSSCCSGYTGSPGYCTR